MAADTIEGKDSAAFNLVKKHFGKDSYLYKENKLYDFVLSKVGTLSSSKADTVIQGVVEVYRKLNHGKLKKARYDLVKEMKEIRKTSNKHMKMITKGLSSLNNAMEAMMETKTENT